MTKAGGLEKYITSGKQDEKALHFSTGKLGLDQLDLRVLVEDALVMNYGEYKYERDNWRKGNNYSEMLGSALRHVMAFALGEDFDPESGLHHLAQARINLMFVRNWQINGVGTDDRNPVPGYDMENYREWLDSSIQRGKDQRAQRSQDEARARLVAKTED